MPASWNWKRVAGHGVGTGDEVYPLTIAATFSIPPQDVAGGEIDGCTKAGCAVRSFDRIMADNDASLPRLTVIDDAQGKVERENGPAVVGRITATRKPYASSAT